MALAAVPMNGDDGLEWSLRVFLRFETLLEERSGQLVQDLALEDA